MQALGNPTRRSINFHFPSVLLLSMGDIVGGETTFEKKGCWLFGGVIGARLF